MNKIILTQAEWKKAFPIELLSLLSIEDFTMVKLLELRAYTIGITKEEIGSLMEMLERIK